MTEEVKEELTANDAPSASGPINYHEFHSSIFEKVKIMICTPMYGGTCLGSYTRSMNDLVMLCAKNNIHVQYFYLFNESLIQRARNYCADEFLRSDCTHMIFIDADIGFNPVMLLQMVAVQLSNPEKYQIVAAPYPKKNINWTQVAEAVKTGVANAQNLQALEYFGGDLVMNFIPGTTQFKIEEPVSVLEAGTGFMLITREVFEKWAAAYPEMSYKPDHLGTKHFDGARNIHAFFHCDIDPKTGRYLSEDYYFCQKWIDCGGTIHMCPWMELDHTGTYTFKGSIPALAALERGKNEYMKAQQNLAKPIGPLRFDPNAINVGNTVTGKTPGMKKKKKTRNVLGGRP